MSEKKSEGKKRILIFHPEINRHPTNNDYTKRISGILEKEYEIRSLEWFVRHPFASGVRCMYLNWFENTIGNGGVFKQKLQYQVKTMLLVWARMRRITLVYVVHNKTPHSMSFDSPVYLKAARGFIRRMLTLADVVVTLCEHTLSYLEAEYSVPGLAEKTCLVPHGRYTKAECDPQSYRDKYGIAENDILFSFVGKMDQYKNIDIIIESFYLANVNAKLLLVGKIDEKYRETVCGLIRDERVVTDFNYVSDEDMSGILQAADVVVLPYENTSLNSGIMINAFSNGTTVAGTNIEMLQDFDPDLVFMYSYSGRQQHVAELAKAMSACVAEGKDSLNDKGRRLEETVCEKNNWSLVEAALLKACG